MTPEKAVEKTPEKAVEKVVWEQLACGCLK